MRPIKSRDEYYSTMLPLTGDKAGEISNTSSRLQIEGYRFRDLKAEAIYSAVSDVLTQQQKTCEKESAYSQALEYAQVLNDAAASKIFTSTGERTIINGDKPLLTGALVRAAKLFAPTASPTFFDVIENAKQESASHDTALDVLERMTQVANELDNLQEVGQKRGRG